MLHTTLDSLYEELGPLESYPNDLIKPLIDFEGARSTHKHNKSPTSVYLGYFTEFMSSLHPPLHDKRNTIEKCAEELKQNIIEKFNDNFYGHDYAGHNIKHMYITVYSDFDNEPCIDVIVEFHPQIKPETDLQVLKRFREGLQKKAKLHFNTEKKKKKDLETAEKLVRKLDLPDEVKQQVIESARNHNE